MAAPAQDDSRLATLAYHEAELLPLEEARTLARIALSRFRQPIWVEQKRQMTPAEQETHAALMATANETGRRYYLKETVIQLIEDSLSPEQRERRLDHLINEAIRLELESRRLNRDRSALLRVMDELRRRSWQLQKLLKAADA